MAGNTKFLGFGKTPHGEDTGVIFLERWGGRASVKVSEESVAELRRACIEILPKVPPPPTYHPEFNASYDGSGNDFIAIAVSTKGAETLLDILDRGRSAENNSEFSASAFRILRNAITDRKKYLSKVDEPGIDS